MEIKQFVEEKKKFETYLTLAVSNLNEKFREKTGYSPSSINVNMMPVQEIGIKEPQYIVSSVTVNVDI